MKLINSCQAAELIGVPGRKFAVKNLAKYGLEPVHHSAVGVFYDADVVQAALPKIQELRAKEAEAAAAKEAEVSTEDPIIEFQDVPGFTGIDFPHGICAKDFARRMKVRAIKIRPHAGGHVYGFKRSDLEKCKGKAWVTATSTPFSKMCRTIEDMRVRLDIIEAKLVELISLWK